MLVKTILNGANTVFKYQIKFVILFVDIYVLFGNACLNE